MVSKCIVFLALCAMPLQADFVTGMNRGRTDMATPYLRDVLRFIGLHDPRFVLIGPTVGPPGPIDAARRTAHRRLAETAAGF